MKKNPVILTRRGEKIMLASFYLMIVLLISFAEDLAGLLNG